MPFILPEIGTRYLITLNDTRGIRSAAVSGIRCGGGELVPDANRSPARPSIDYPRKEAAMTIVIVIIIPP